jgi:pantoate--beta-alanine ligase
VIRAAARRHQDLFSAEPERRDMRTVETVAELRACIAALRQRGGRVGLVPTMGNLHQGHLSLIDTARRHGADAVVVSIFVNPLQFGPKEDYAAYPRTPEDDHAALAGKDVALVFAPTVEEMYPGGQGATTRVEVPGLSTILCGHFRPGHFVGVATIVAKLFNMAQPDLAVFGEKDYQQLVLIRRMAGDLCLPIEVIGSPTVREDDGLAMSSRNRFLSAEERARAPELHRALCDAAAAAAVEGWPFTAIEERGMARLETAGFRPEYFAVRDALTLAEPAPDRRDLVVLAAAWLGRTRLIDNVAVNRARQEPTTGRRDGRFPGSTLTRSHW